MSIPFEKILSRNSMVHEWVSGTAVILLSLRNPSIPAPPTSGWRHGGGDDSVSIDRSLAVRTLFHSMPKGRWFRIKLTLGGCAEPIIQLPISCMFLEMIDDDRRRWQKRLKKQKFNKSTGNSDRFKWEEYSACASIQLWYMMISKSEWRIGRQGKKKG